MRRLFFLFSFAFIGTATKAQTVHSVGLGAFGTVPMVTGNHSQANGEYFLVRASPFVNYTFEYNWLNFSVGAGNWNSTFQYDVEFDSTFNNPSGGKGTVIYGHNYLFAPVTAGVNVVTNDRWEVVLEGVALLKYMHLLNFDVESDDPDIAKAIRSYRSGQLDLLGYKLFSTSVGGGFYIEYHLASFVPKLQLGYLTDMNNVLKTGSDSYKFNHPYAAFTLNYILKYTEKLQPHDRRVRW
jgi:hypothetical protein